MIYSMTAFARVQQQGSWGNLVCELRSINHRYLEISVHLPEALRAFEMGIRERIRAKLQRGKIECVLRYQPAPGASISINMGLAEELCQASEKVARFLSQPAPIEPSNILRFQGVLEPIEGASKTIEPALFALIDEALVALTAARNREGEDLKQLFLQRMRLLTQELDKVRERLPQLLLEQRERLLKRFTDISITLDSQRLEQEMVLMLQRSDVAEEIDRTHTHISEIRRVLEQGGVIGRRMDFLLQELNREANTLGSKSSDAIVTHAAVEMKVLIEQVREQVQNIE